MITLLLLAVAVAPTACHPVGGEQILGRDLAAADGRFASMPPDAAVGYAPAAGARRTLHPAELTRIATRYAVPPDSFEDVCFDRAMQTLDRAKTTAAMRAALDLPEGQINIVESSLYPVPPGEIVFPRAGLTPPRDGVALWRGYVHYGLNRRFPVWARVRALEQTKDVVRGERVKVEVHAGAAQLNLEGRAESGGRTGETVSVLNPKTGKRFYAQVTGKGKVLVSQ